MTNAQLQLFINQWIYTNANNEITAASLNPVLQAIRNFAFDITGDTNNLTTTDHTNLVAAINEIRDLLVFYPNAVLVLQGLQDPNVVGPPAYKIADFYLQVDGSGNPIQLFQFDGFSWVMIGGSANYGKTPINLYAMLSGTVTVPLGMTVTRIVSLNTGESFVGSVLGTTLTITDGVDGDNYLIEGYN